jgi:hypothetical protein
MFTYSSLSCLLAASPPPQDTGPHGDTLKELVDNVKDTLTGKKHHKEDDK